MEQVAKLQKKSRARRYLYGAAVAATAALSLVAYAATRPEPPRSEGPAYSPIQTAPTTAQPTEAATPPAPVPDQSPVAATQKQLEEAANFNRRMDFRNSAGKVSSLLIKVNHLLSSSSFDSEDTIKSNIREADRLAQQAVLAAIALSPTATQQPGIAQEESVCQLAEEAAKLRAADATAFRQWADYPNLYPKPRSTIEAAAAGLRFAQAINALPAY